MNPISRRSVLRGIGATVALPFLDAMAPISALAATAKPSPVRLGFVFVPNGVNMQSWRPATSGALGQLPETLASMQKISKKLNIITGLAQQHAEANGDGPGDHARSAAAWLTGCQPKKTNGADIHVGISADQLAAQHIGSQTKFPSLELGCERGAQAGDCDSGYSCAYSGTVSWSSATTPLAKEVNPRLAFERLFGQNSESPETAARRQSAKLSILDLVATDATALRAKLGITDQRKLDEYLTAVRDLEVRLQRFESTQASMVRDGAAFQGTPADFREHVRLMAEIMVLAFQSDQTRICSFMIANEGSNRPYPLIGIGEGHHEISHHGNDPAKLAAKQRIDRFHADLVAELLLRLDAVQDGEGTLLDHSLILFGAGISDGNRHNHDDLPLVLAGRGGGTVRAGNHWVFEPRTPMNNLLVSMLGRAGVNLEHIGDSNGRVRELF